MSTQSFSRLNRTIYTPMSNRPLLVVLLLCSFLAAAGCTHRNQRLNSTDTRIEARRTNRTRAALAAEPPAIVAQADQRIRPATAPTTTIADTAGTYPRDDGYFVGIAISGGG